MLARSDIQRSLANLTVNLHRAMQNRATIARAYGLAEREFQAQHEFSGRIGALPVEVDIDIDFSVMFVPDPGMARDSTLDRPHARLSIEWLQCPSGVVPYVGVARWKQDGDFNYIGAVVRVGVHYPAYAINGLVPEGVRFFGILHASFQAYGCPLDSDIPQDIDVEELL